MAVKVLTLADVTGFDDFVACVTEAATVASDGFEVTADGDIMLFVENVSGATAYDLTVKAGNAMQGVADYLEEIPISGRAMIKLSSGKFKNISGTDKGKYKIIPENVAIQVKAFKF